MNEHISRYRVVFKPACYKGILLVQLRVIIRAFVYARNAALCKRGVAQEKLTPRAVEYLTPKIEAMILPSVESELQQGAAELMNQAGETGFTIGDQTMTVSDLAEFLKPFGLDLRQSATEQSEQVLEPVAQAAASKAAAYFARREAGLMIFFVSYLVLYLVLYNVALVLNIVARLPVLHTLNQAGGAILGFCGCLLVMMVSAMVVRSSALLPADPGPVTSGLLALSQQVLPGP